MPQFAHGVIDRGRREPLCENVEEYPQQRLISLGKSHSADGVGA
jgi:hypothetical protein